MRRPSPCARAGPHTKQVGSGCSCDLIGVSSSAAHASSKLAFSSRASSRLSGRPVATTVAPSRSSHDPPSVAITSSCLSSGGGARSVTSAPPLLCRASRPQTYPPFPEFGGPQYRLSMVIDVIDLFLSLPPPAHST